MENGIKKENVLIDSAPVKWKEKGEKENESVASLFFNNTVAFNQEEK